jgi:hypothetical protein
MQLLRLLGLQMADPSEIIRVVGIPEAVYENGKYPGIFYWRFRSYWVTSAPLCVMILPRSVNYDMMFEATLQQSGSRRVSLDAAMHAARTVHVE